MKYFSFLCEAFENVLFTEAGRIDEMPSHMRMCNCFHNRFGQHWINSHPLYLYHLGYDVSRISKSKVKLFTSYATENWKCYNRCTVFKEKMLRYFYLELNGNGLCISWNKIHHVQVKVFDNQEKENFRHLTA